MVTQITLGSFSNINGKSILGGAGGSGLDTQTIVSALVAAKSLPATNDQTQITNNGKVSAALTSFQTLLGTLQNAASALRNPPGISNNANNVFDFTTTSGGDNYVTATTTAGAALQSYNISNISQLATAAVQGTASYTVASANAPIVSSSAISGTSHQFAPGTITVNGQSVTLNQGDSLNDVAAAFNAVSSQSGISATVIQVGTGQYQLSFNATQTGAANSFDLTSSSTVSDPNGVLANAGIGTATAGQDAKFELNGVNIDRPTNNISDAVNDVTFNLLQTTPDTTTNHTITVSADTTTTQNSIVGFVNAYNAIQTFVAQQTQLNSDGTYASTAVLANNQVFRQTVADLQQNINAQVTGISSGGLSSLASLGITLTTQPANGTTPQVPNILTVDDGKLTSALSTNFNGVKNLFGINMTSSNPSLAIYSDTKGLDIANFSINADPSNNTFTATYTQNGVQSTVNLTASPIAGNAGYTLVGPSGSALDGLTLIYASNNAGTANVNVTDGIADKIYNTANTATAANTGTLAVEQTGIQTQNSTLNDSIKQINLQVAQYQDGLLKKFAALEAAVQSVNTLLASLSANDNAKLEAAN